MRKISSVSSRRKSHICSLVGALEPGPRHIVLVTFFSYDSVSVYLFSLSLSHYSLSFPLASVASVATLFLIFYLFLPLFKYSLSSLLFPVFHSCSDITILSCINCLSHLLCSFCSSLLCLTPWLLLPLLHILGIKINQQIVTTSQHSLIPNHISFPY